MLQKCARVCVKRQVSDIYKHLISSLFHENILTKLTLSISQHLIYYSRIVSRIIAKSYLKEALRTNSEQSKLVFAKN